MASPIHSFISSSLVSPMSSLSDSSPPVNMKYDLSNHSRTKSIAASFKIGSIDTSSASSDASMGLQLRKELKRSSLLGAIEYVKQINLKNPSTTHYLKTIDQSEYIVDTLDHDSLANWIEQGDFESSLMFQFESENSDTARQIRADIGQSLKRHFSSDAHGNITLANIDVPEALKQTEKLLRNFEIPASDQKKVTRHSKDTEGKTLIEKAKQANEKESYALLQRLDSPLTPISPEHAYKGLYTKSRFTVIKGDY